MKLSGEELLPGNTTGQVHIEEPERNRNNSDSSYKIKVSVPWGLMHLNVLKVNYAQRINVVEHKVGCLSKA